LTNFLSNHTYLSIGKTTVYLLLILLGIVLRQFDQPNSVFILGGIGLFYGHICYRVLNNLEKKKKGLMFFIVVTVAIIIILFYKKPSSSFATSDIMS